MRAKTSIDQQAPAPASKTQGAVDSLANQNPAGQPGLSVAVTDYVVRP